MNREYQPWNNPRDSQMNFASTWKNVYQSKGTNWSLDELKEMAVTPSRRTPAVLYYLYNLSE